MLTRSGICTPNNPARRQGLGPRTCFPWPGHQGAPYVPWTTIAKARAAAAASSLRLLTEWGTDRSVCNGVVDGSRLRPWRRKYRVLLVCGIADPTVDMLADTRITLSAPFNIQPRPMSISAPFSQAMAAAAKAAVERASTDALRGSAVTRLMVSWHVWFQVILLPVGADASVVRRLSDVPLSGGIALTGSLGTSTLSVSLVPIRKPS